MGAESDPPALHWTSRLTRVWGAGRKLGQRLLVEVEKLQSFDLKIHGRAAAVAVVVVAVVQRFLVSPWPQHLKRKDGAGIQWVLLQ